MSNIRNNGSGSIISSYSFSLDNLGNHLQENVTEPYTTPGFPTQSLSYTYSNANRILSAGSTSFGFDNNGNTTSKTGYTFTYDQRNNLTGSSGNYNASFTYDGIGNRRSVTSSGITSRYVIDILGMSRVLMETNSAGTPINYYVYGLGLISRIEPDNTTNYYVYDFRGSTVAMTDATPSANVTHSYAYDPFGNIVYIAEADFNPFRYVGGHGVMYEDKSLYFMRARYYDPEIGRFLSEDPIWSANLYPYADNNPVIKIDPKGRYLINKVKTSLDQFLKHSKQIERIYKAGDTLETMYDLELAESVGDIYNIGVGMVTGQIASSASVFCGAAKPICAVVLDYIGEKFGEKIIGPLLQAIYQKLKPPIEKFKRKTVRGYENAVGGLMRWRSPRLFWFLYGD